MKKDMNELKQEMREEFERNMNDLMDYCLEQQEEEEIIGQQILEKEESMNRMLELYEFLQRAERKLAGDIDKAIPEYDELIKKANQSGVKKYVVNLDLKGLLNKAKSVLKIRKDKADKYNEDIEMAEININKLMNITYDLSSQLNQIRYKARKTPEDKMRMQEIIKELEVLKADIDKLMEMTESNNN